MMCERFTSAVPARFVGGAEFGRRDAAASLLYVASRRSGLGPHCVARSASFGMFIARDREAPQACSQCEERAEVANAKRSPLPRAKEREARGERAPRVQSPSRAMSEAGARMRWRCRLGTHPGMRHWR